MSTQNNIYQKQIDLKNSRILITGGTSGLGKELALQLNKLGATVAIIARRTNPLDAIKSQFPDIITIQGDVSNKDEIYKLSGNVLGHLGGIDKIGRASCRERV